MHPILEKPRRLLGYLAAWIPLTGIMVALLVLSGHLAPAEAAILSVPANVFFAFFCLSSWYLCRVTPLEETPVIRGVLTFTLAGGVSGSLWVLSFGTSAHTLGLFPGFETLPDRLSHAVPVVFLLGFLIYLFSAAFHYVLLAVAEARTAALREADARGLARDAELTALRSQLNPHFLFNALNSISALTAKDPARAREMCLRLASFFRKTLGLSSKKSIKLAEELDLIRDYLDLEKTRFGDRLLVVEEIDSSLSQCEVPPLFLQPLVENALKHGLEEHLEGGTIRVTACQRGETLLITVENPAVMEESPRRGAGMGLTLVQNRIRAFYGAAAHMNRILIGGLFRVEISVPLPMARG